MSVFLRNNRAASTVDTIDGQGIVLFRSHETNAQLRELGLPADEFCTPFELEQIRRGEAFFDAIETLSSDMQASIKQYIGFIATAAAHTGAEDMKFNVKKMHKGLIDENVEMLEVIKDLKSQIKGQDTTVKSLEEAQLAQRSLSKQNEELKARLEQLEKEKTKIQNQLAKTTIANEKLEAQLELHIKFNNLKAKGKK